MGQAKIENMVAAGDPLDVAVRFASSALEGMKEFDWQYIAGKDVPQKEEG